MDLTQINQTPQALDRDNVLGRDADQNSDRYMAPVVDVRAVGPTDDQDCHASCTDSDITLQDLIVHDGQWDGIYVGAGYSDPASGRFGYVAHLTIKDVESRGNQSAGIEAAGTLTRDNSYRLQDVRVLDDYLHDNGGDGAVLGQVQDGLIQGSRCSYNGHIRNARVGCWAWNSKRVTIQYNESDHNMTPLSDSRATDGGGFDLDMGSVDSVMQYNWSHDNEGEGYLLESWPTGTHDTRGTTTGVTVRYNVSERDGQKKAEGISVLGEVNPAWVYNNTVYHVVSPYRGGANKLSGTGGDLTTSSYPGAGSPVLSVFNNVFITDGTANPAAPDTNLWSDGKGTFNFDNNLWERIEGGVGFTWGGRDVPTWSAWQALGFDRHGEDADPKLIGPIGAGPSGYQLKAGSPAIGAGTAPSVFAAGDAATDYFGTPVLQRSRYDVGATAYTTSYSSLNSHASLPAPPAFSSSEHLASVAVKRRATAPADPVSKGSTVSWVAQVVDQVGSPATGTQVEAVVYTPDWTSVRAMPVATTDSHGVAEFTLSTRASDSPGTYFVVFPQVLPKSQQAYYDSSQNRLWTMTFELK